MLGVSEGEFGRVTRVWGGRCVPFLYDPFLLLGELRGLRRVRGEVVGQAQGRVLELGAGTGLNMKYYSGVERLVLSEPEPGMAKRLEQRLMHSAVSGEVVSAAAEQLPFDDGSFDTVVATMVFCTVSDPHAALHETRRVLAPGGRLLFIGWEGGGGGAGGGGGGWVRTWGRRGVRGSGGEHPKRRSAYRARSWRCRFATRALAGSLLSPLARVRVRLPVQPKHAQTDR